MTYDKMIDEVIKKYGHEAKETINFCLLCEKAIKNNEDAIKRIAFVFKRLTEA